MQWEQVYAELLNKIRWSIASTMTGQGFNCSYQESIALASVLAGDALRLIKLRQQKPELRMSVEEVRSLLRTEG